MNPGYSTPLYLLPFDHRESYVTGMFLFKLPLTADEHEAVAGSKQIIYDGFRQALASEVPVACAGILVDEEFACQSKKATRQEAVSRIAQRYREWITIFEHARVSHASADDETD